MERRTIIFFESPHRVVNMLTDVYEILGDREVALAKEMTKIFEEVTRGLLHTILSSLKDREIKGEYTVIVQGLKKGDRAISVIDNR